MNCGAKLAGAPAAAPSVQPIPSLALPSTSEPLHEAMVSLEGERKPVTILFTDIVGSTTLAEKLDPEEWKEIVNGAHQRVSAAVYRYEGTIAQLLGDGVLAFFGAPTTHEDDPVRSVRAAIEIQQAIADYGRSLAGYVDNFQMRIGIHTGLVILGNVGTDKHWEYLAVGDAVNLAARLQSAAQPGKILISEATARLTRSAFNLEDLGEISVKGKADPVQVYQMVAPKAVPERERGIQGLVSPLVGREHEMEQLRAVLADLAQGRGHIVSILGEPGIGKSRLAEEARNSGEWMVGSGQSTVHLQSTHHYPLPTVHWLEGRSLSYGQTLAYWTISQLLRSDLGVSDDDPEPKVRAALRKRVQSLFPDAATDILLYLAHLLGLKLQGEEAERVQMLDGETLKRQILVTLCRYFEGVANLAPTVLVFEDLHWADPSTLEALGQLLEVTDRAPLLMLLLFRPERDLPSWRVKVRVETDYAHRYTEIALKPLSSSHSNQLISALLDIADLPEKTRNQILGRSEGNPFYLEEIVRHLIDRKAIIRDDAHWRATRDLESIEIPDTLQGVLLARMDRLDEDVRRTLQLASVIGRSFLYKLLQAISEAERTLDRHLSQLQRADLVREKTRKPELEYIFKHSLTQEAAYDSLLIERRREFHRRVGVALEELFGARKQEYYGLLAYHFDRAGENEKAVEYLLAAGDRTRLEDAHAEAIGYYRRAVARLTEIGDTELAAKTWLKLGLVYHTNFEFEAAHQANEAAFALQQAARSKRQPRLAGPARSVSPTIYRTSPPVEFGSFSLDPAYVYNIGEFTFCASIFAGIAEIDRELNLVPHAARSWEVLEGGTLYIIHLRDDVYWTDGTPVTAHDYEWAWKRNLEPGMQSEYVVLLDDVVGARDYRTGRNPDPDSVRVHALDPLTLEVRLNVPIAYFPYILAAAIAYPLPRHVVERNGADWWKPEHIMSNGAFRLIEFSKGQAVYERNPAYFGEFHGNIDRIEVEFCEKSKRLELYLENRYDRASFDELPRESAMIQIPPDERIFARTLAMHYILFLPNHPPLDDVRVRRALILALDRRRLTERAGLPIEAAAWGGIVPPGMPGHSPDIGLPFDVQEARRLLGDAGYPDGVNFPVLQLGYPFGDMEEILRQWRDYLGITVNAILRGAHHEESEILDMYHDGWLADYPDPDSFLRNSLVYLRLSRWGGWQDKDYDQLVNKAAHTTDRGNRMSMYRQADRMLVIDQVLVAPLSYSFETLTLAKPWLENPEPSPLGYMINKDIRIRRPLP